MKLTTFNYTVQRQRVRKIALGPALSETLFVTTNGFGYLSEDQRPIATCSIISCVGVYMRNSAIDLRALIHLDPRIDHFEAIIAAIRTLVEKKLIQKPDFDDVRLITTILSSRYATERVYATLKMLGMEPRVMRYALPWITEYIFDREGNLTLARKPKCDKMPPPIREVMRRERNRVMVCENDGEDVTAPQTAFETYSGLPLRTFRKGKGDEVVYQINLRLPEHVPDDILLGINGEYYLGVALKTCSHGRYASIKTTYGQSPFAIRIVQAVAISLAAKIEKLGCSERRHQVTN